MIIPDANLLLYAYDKESPFSQVISSLVVKITFRSRTRRALFSGSF